MQASIFVCVIIFGYIMLGGLSFQSFSLSSVFREPPSCRANVVKLFLFIFHSVHVSSRLVVRSRVSLQRMRDSVERRKTI